MFSTQTVVVTVVVGTGITLLAGLFPAMRATRVQPIAAVREGAVLPVGRFHRYKPYVAGAVIVLAFLAIAAGVLSGGGAKSVLVPAAGGMLLLFIGVAMISGRLVAPLIRVVGVPRAGSVAPWAGSHPPTPDGTHRGPPPPLRR